MGDSTLSNLLRNEKSYDAKFTVNQMARLLHAIHGMHKCGVVHRGVSPKNIVVANNGDFTLFDFSSCVITTAGAMINGGEFASAWS